MVSPEDMRTGWRVLLRPRNPLGLPADVPYLLGHHLEAIGRFLLYDVQTGTFVGDVQPSQVTTTWQERQA
jgi:hypothetical protein